MAVIKQHFLALDGLRGVAAICVVLFHHGWISGDIYLMDYGYMAVDFFFLLSGFVIAFAYEDRLRSGMTLADFFWVRVRRLYPLILLGTLLALAYYAISLRKDTDALIKVGLTAPFALLVLPNWPTFDFHPGPPGMFPVDGPLWSIFFEIVANMTYALLAPRLQTKILIGIVVVSGILECFAASSVPEISQIGDHYKNMWGLLPRVMFPYFAGVLIYRLHKMGVFPRYPVGIAILAFILILVFFPGRHPHSSPIYFLACVSIVFPLVVIAGAAQQPKGWAAALASFGGNMSYPVYALHVPVILWFEAIQVHFHLLQHVPGTVVLLAELTAIGLIAYAALKLYDEPVRAFLARHTKRSARPAVATGKA